MNTIEKIIGNKNIDIFIKLFEKINHAFFQLSFKSKKFSICKYRIFNTKMIFWKHLFDDCLYKIMNEKCNEAVVYDITYDVVEYLKKHNLVSIYLLDFFKEFHKHLSIQYVENLNKIIKNKEISKEEKLKKFVDDALELLNITYIELNDIRIDCSFFNPEIKCDICKNNPNCISCEDEDNVIKLNLLPEYFLFDNVYENILNTLMKIHPSKSNKLLLIINYELVCNENKIFSWEKTKSDIYYEKLKSIFPNIYFMNCHCVDFGKYTNKLKEENRIINNEYEYYTLIDDWRIKQNKKPKYLNFLKIA